jgi:hypothetical protein
MTPTDFPSSVKTIPCDGKAASTASTVVRDDVDAPCADAFLQAMLFKSEKYAWPISSA